MRFEYLQAKLSREITETNGVYTVKLPADAHTNIIGEMQMSMKSATESRRSIASSRRVSAAVGGLRVAET